MNRRFPAATAVILLSLFALISPCVAGEWVAAGSDQPGFHIMDAAVSGDGAYGTLAGDAGLILFTSDGEELWRSSEGGYRTVSLSNGGNVLAAGGDGIFILVKNSTEPSVIRTKNYVNDIAVTADGSRIAVVVDDETLRLYTPEGAIIRSTDTGDDLVSVAISPDGTYIAGGSVTGNVVLFSADGEERWSYELSRQPVSSVAIANGARTIAAVSEDGAVSLLSRAGGLLWSGSAPHSGGVAVTEDGAIAAVADRQGVRIIERDGTPAGTISGMDASVSVAMDNGGNLIVVTDGIRISDYTKCASALEMTGVPAETTVAPEASQKETMQETRTPDGDVPVPTRSSFPLMAVMAGMVLPAGMILLDRRHRDKS